jgi:signal transduction histidine kinase
MEPSILEVGIGVVDGKADTVSHAEAAAMATDRVIAQVEGCSLPLRALLLLATADWCDTSDPLSAAIRVDFLRRLGYSPPLIGSSSPGIFAYLPSERHPHHVENGFVLIGLFSDDLFLTVECCERPHDDIPGRPDAVKLMADRLNKAQLEHIGLGTGAEAALFAFFPGPFINQKGERVYLDVELHQEVLNAFGDSYALYGGAAADSLESPSVGYQFINDRCLKSSLVVAHLEYEFEFDGRMDHGFLPVRAGSVSVDGLATDGVTRDHVVTRLDGEPALKRLKELAQEFHFTSYTPTLGLGGGENAHIVTTLAPLQAMESRSDGSVRLNRKVGLGYRLSILNASPEELHGRSMKAFESAFKRMDNAGNWGRLLFGLTSVGRFVTYDQKVPGNRWQGTDKLAAIFPRMPVVYGLSAGEFGEDHRRRPRADNLSVWATWFAGVRNPRSLNRLQMLKLLKVADDLIGKSSVEQVMQAAIDCPTEDLAEGGQVCTYDAASSTILGGQHGYASSRPDSKINPVVLSSKTTRLVPAEGVVYKMPENLKAWCMNTGERPVVRREVDPYENSVDILSFVAANGVAIFVPDSTDPTFLCDVALVHSSGIGPQFVMALRGQRGQLIATLQLFFHLDYHMNREELAQWVSYGQKVGIALERALEHESREATEHLSALTSSFMQHPAQQSPFPESEVVEYLAALQTLLKADYVHLRIRERLDGMTCRYRLVAPPGSMKDEHAKTHFYISRDEGSLFFLLQDDERITSTLEETRQEYSRLDQAHRSHFPEFRHWQLAGMNFKTFSMSLLGPKEDPLGCLAVHSTMEHFFTERRLELIQHARRDLQALIEKRESDFNESKLKERETAILLLALLSANSFHDTFGPLANIRSSASHVRQLHPEDPVVVKEMSDIVTLVNSLVAQLQQRRESVSAGPYQARLRDLIEASKKEMKRKWCGLEDMSGEGWDCVVDAHPAVRVAISQLLDNATEYTGGKENAVWIGGVKLSDDGRRIEFRIENEGGLMDREQVNRMRQIGYSSKSVGEHSGFGIPIAEVALMHRGGQLALEPREKGGLVATIRLVTIDAERSSAWNRTSY